MKLVPLVALAVLALVVAAPAAGESLPLPAEPPDFVDRYIVGHPVEPPDFVDRFVVGHGVQPMDSADRYAAGRVVHPPDFVDRFVARERAQSTLSSTASASTSHDGATIPLVALLAVAAAMLATLAVVLRRRVPQPV